jgi:hypothetical protein
MIFSGAIKPHLANKETLEQSDNILIGDVSSDDEGVEFCVTSVANSESVGSGITEVKTDNNFVIVTVKIANNSNEPYDVNALNFSLIDSSGNEYEHTNEAMFVYDNFMYIDNVNPGLSNEYTIVYETPTTTIDEEYKLKIVHNIFNDKDHVYITLKDKEQ